MGENLQPNLGETDIVSDHLVASLGDLTMDLDFSDLQLRDFLSMVAKSLGWLILPTPAEDRLKTPDGKSRAGGDERPPQGSLRPLRHLAARNGRHHATPALLRV